MHKLAANLILRPNALLLVVLIFLMASSSVKISSGAENQTDSSEITNIEKRLDDLQSTLTEKEANAKVIQGKIDDLANTINSAPDFDKAYAATKQRETFISQMSVINLEVANLQTKIKTLQGDTDLLKEKAAFQAVRPTVGEDYEQQAKFKKEYQALLVSLKDKSMDAAKQDEIYQSFCEKWGLANISVVPTPLEWRDGKIQLARCRVCLGSGKCQTCNGTGWVKITCSQCGGTGEIRIVCPACHGHDKFCPRCGGKGYIVLYSCPKCLGTGTLPAPCKKCNQTGKCDACKGTGLATFEQMEEENRRQLLQGAN